MILLVGASNESRSSAGVLSTLNYRAIFPAHIIFFNLEICFIFVGVLPVCTLNVWCLKRSEWEVGYPQTHKWLWVAMRVPRIEPGFSAKALNFWAVSAATFLPLVFSVYVFKYSKSVWDLSLSSVLYDLFFGSVVWCWMSWTIDSNIILLLAETFLNGILKGLNKINVVNLTLSQ